ncbi:MAG TPA: OmpA family protein [Bacteroidales bacterium]|nr:OmpA family protein [Bacteroidales bacterium]HOS57226.1 OmpA family protein [Bacteroidales bacterium]HRT13650.1 OmpA family protein [Bacteroidales bacterium]HXK73800.1 OmpA family protein [Bacteroidales bacterium]
MKIKIAFLLSLTILFTGVSAIKAQHPLKEADNAFKYCQYEKALDEYKTGIRKIRKNQIEVRRVTYQIAECYRIMGDIKNAEKFYERLEKKNYQKDNPMILFHLGNIALSKGEYADALKYFENFKKRAPEDKRTDVLIESCQKAKTWTENPTRYEVENFKKFNTRQDDWAPRWGNPNKQNQIIFSSNRDGSVGKGTNQWTGGGFSDIYKSDKPKSKNTEWPGEWSPTLPLDEDQIINTSVNEGEASANAKGTTIYFTKCPQDKKKVYGCYVYQASRKGKSWSVPELVELGPDSFNYVHPFISDDELTIYFASNKPGGYGGYDIYKATRAKKSAKFGNIKNLGNVVNTPGQEVFPALRGDSVLYFSSDGHPGMGGLDIFYSKIKDGVFEKPENMMYPINSNADDIGMMFDDSKVIDPKSKSEYLEKGFFSSNRPGGRGGDDIYYFVLRPLVFTLSGFVKDALTLQYIDKADVEIIGTDGTSYKTKTDIKGYYHFDKTMILSNVTYKMRVTKSKYWEENNTASQTTVGLTENTDLKQDFLLTPYPVEPIVLPEILYDLDKADLKPQYKDSLMSLYEIMIKNPTIVVELRSHTDFRASDEYNEELSQRRAQSCVDFLVYEKGIDADRIIPKGYGEYKPRKLEKDMTITYNRKKFTFKKGTVLTEMYITGLTSRDEQEAANQLNRRTEFMILRDDYVPKGDKIEDVEVQVPKPIAVIVERTVPITIENDVVKATCIANNKTFTFELAPNSEEIYMNYADATRFLKEMIITVNDFEDKENSINLTDGSIVEGSAIYLNNLKIGDDTAENVRVIVKKALTSSFVIGGDYITDEFGTYTIDSERNLIVFDK